MVFSSAKSPLRSKTLWGGVVMLGSLALGQFGVEVTADEQATLTDQLVSIADLVGGTIGFGLVVWGRFSARERVAIGPVAKPAAGLMLAGVLLFSAGCESAAYRANLQRQASNAEAFEARVNELTLPLSPAEFDAVRNWVSLQADTLRSLATDGPEDGR